MSTHNFAHRLVTIQEPELAEVIELPVSDAPSFYQRNSGSLPKSETGMGDTHRRSTLPKPENDDTTTMMDRVRGLLRR